ncbi:hypothetical protein CC85DRAFT_292961 [Cutaneotrichosporon oleaginosum]|uniref:Uncharacterized protein n=1 Tax=Cutaneotrichosporon oleaginosum TaxID=879819 RepID=A0A0J0XIN4_9TREE|nr:uncharacterized protein CC85DRAFT_292961 [Cutaneotrichosporon oleaginosum]KLT40941.1 hypothetical protein CC85DRAFT_292961 [Cutaneotrichosporon oleaginosum]TXT15433.1 hypothetical protein COLE_01626 [Cutaneotrichosporon oleaginosum]
MTLSVSPLYLPLHILTQAEDKTLVIKMLVTCQGMYKAEHPGVNRPDKKHNAFINAVASELGMSNAERDEARAAGKGGDARASKSSPEAGETATPKAKAPPKTAAKAKAAPRKPRAPGGKKVKEEEKPSPRKRRRTSESEKTDENEAMDEDEAEGAEAGDEDELTAYHTKSATPVTSASSLLAHQFLAFALRLNLLSLHHPRPTVLLLGLRSLALPGLARRHGAVDDLGTKAFAEVRQDLLAQLRPAVARDTRKLGARGDRRARRDYGLDDGGVDRALRQQGRSGRTSISGVKSSFLGMLRERRSVLVRTGGMVIGVTMGRGTVGVEV